MLKIFYNTNHPGTMTVDLAIRGTFCKITCKDSINGRVGADTIESMHPYSSYGLTESCGLVKNYRKVLASDYRWLDYNRLGVATKLDFSEITQLYGKSHIVQIDTGILTEVQKDIVVRIFTAQKENITIDTDQEYELLPFDSMDLVLGDHPRMTLWDSYSLSANGREFTANRKGAILSGDPEEPLLPEEGKDYIEFTIQKYKGPFTERLTREIDNEEVFVEASAGLVNNRRVPLISGVGTFRLYPFGHKGPTKIKLGRKWYEVWNDYCVMIGEKE